MATENDWRRKIYTSRFPIIEIVLLAIIVFGAFGDSSKFGDLGEILAPLLAIPSVFLLIILLIRRIQYSQPRNLYESGGDWETTRLQGKQKYIASNILLQIPSLVLGALLSIFISSGTLIENTMFAVLILIGAPAVGYIILTVSWNTHERSYREASAANSAANAENT